MKRGESYGGGESSLGYLFGSDNKQKTDQVVPPASPSSACTPPYGIDLDNDYKPLEKISRRSSLISSQDKSKVSNNYPRVQGQNSGNFITDRPSTKVKSVPGGDSSLGYLFGDQSS